MSGWRRLASCVRHRVYSSKLERARQGAPRPRPIRPDFRYGIARSGWAPSVVKRKRKDKSRQLRIGIAIVAGALVVVVAGVGLFFRPDAAPYRTLDVADRTGPVRVVEFFSYGCVHCRSFERLLDSWAESLPEGAVFERAHVAFSEQDRLLARAHFALDRHNALEANHGRIFRAIHDRNRRFTSAEALADFVDGHGVAREAFLATLRSPRAARRVQAVEERYIALGLTGVPALAVDGKYVIGMAGGRREALATTTALVTELIAKRTAPEAG